MSELRRIQLRFIPNNKWTLRSNAESKLSPLLNSTLVARCRLLPAECAPVVAKSSTSGTHTEPIVRVEQNGGASYAGA